MRRFSSRLGRAAAGAAATQLTFVPSDAESLAPRIISWFASDIEAKGLVVPNYVKQPYALTARTKDGRVAISSTGYDAWGELYVAMIAANPENQVPGAGTAMMRAIEQMARIRGCTRIRLDTYSWQARPFYEKLGFNVFAESKNHPKNHNRFFLEKRWDNTSIMDVAPYELKGKRAAAAELTVLPSPQVETEDCLDRWLDKDTQARNIGVPYYVKEEYALQARFPDNTVAAATVFEILWGELHVSLLGAETGHKGAGVGSIMMNKLKEIAKSKGCHRLALETMSFQARPFYERHGMRVIGEQAGMPVKDVQRYYLEMEL